MDENVKPAELEPVIRFKDVCKTFRYRGARIADDADDEEGDIGAAESDDEKEDKGLKPGDFRVALRNINLSIMPGERVGVIGPNGSGKTTLLSIVAGVSHPTSGRVVGRGHVVPLSHVISPLNQSWSGLRNLRALARFLGFPDELVDERSGAIASFAGMEKDISQPVRTYSRNMYARLAFAAALEFDGDIYVSDDTIGVGDQAYQSKCFKRLVRLCESGKTLLFSTHKLRLVEQLCTRAIWLDKGQVRADSQPVTITSIYRLNQEEAQTDPEEIQENGEANPTASWFKQKYGFSYPLPELMIETTRPISNPENDGVPEFPSEEAVGGIFSLDYGPKQEPEGVIEDNATLSIRAGINALVENLKVDLMLQVFRGKVLVYQSLLPRPVSIRSPGKLVFEMALDSSLLPDNVYSIRLDALLAPAKGNVRFISRGHFVIATKNCGPKLPARASSFTENTLPALPLRTIDLRWRVVRSQKQREKPAARAVGTVNAHHQKP